MQATTEKTTTTHRVNEDDKTIPTLKRSHLDNESKVRKSVVLIF